MYGSLSVSEMVYEARRQVDNFDFESGSIVDPELVSALAYRLECTFSDLQEAIEHGTRARSTP